MLELFVVGGVWFYTLIAIELLLLFLFVEYENGIGAWVSLAIFAGLLQWCGNVDLIGYVSHHPWNVLGALGAYFLLGAAWGVVKWWIFCRDRLEEYEEFKEKFLRSEGLPVTVKTVPENLRQKFVSELGWSDNKKEGGRTLAEPPQVRHHKSRVVRWMSFWVVSMIWSVLDDFVKRIFKRMYKAMATWLQSVSDSVYGKSTISEDTAVPVPRNVDGLGSPGRR